jgi:hypothetical protein
MKIHGLWWIHTELYPPSENTQEYLEPSRRLRETWRQTLACRGRTCQESMVEDPCGHNFPTGSPLVHLLTTLKMMNLCWVFGIREWRASIMRSWKAWHIERIRCSCDWATLEFYFSLVHLGILIRLDLIFPALSSTCDHKSLQMVQSCQRRGERRYFSWCDIRELKVDSCDMNLLCPIVGSKASGVMRTAFLKVVSICCRLKEEFGIMFPI